MIEVFKSLVSDYSGAEFDVSIYWMKQNKRSHVYFNGSKEKSFRTLDQGVMLSISKNGKVFRQATSILDRNHLKNLIKHGVGQFNQLEKYFLPESSFVCHEGEIRDFSDDNKLEDNEFIQGLEKLSKKTAGYLDHIRSSLGETVEERVLVNSRGGVFQDLKTYSQYNTDLVGEKNNITQNRSNGGVIFQGNIDDSFINRALVEKDQLLKELGELLDAPLCPKMTGSLLLPSDQMYIQIHESIGHPLELDRILGDERNYAGGSFVKKEDFGSLRYGTEQMNVVFDPGQVQQPVGYKFDDTGKKAETEFLIKDGILVAGIGGAESQRRSNVLGTASTRVSNWNRPPIDRMGNINLLAGSSPYMEMVKAIENGVLMKTNRSWSIDDQRDKFQFGCEIGYLIRDGEIKNVVRAPNYEGRTVPFWNSLEMVGDQDSVNDFGTSQCGKGEPNQAVRVGHQSPACLFSNISIFPGE